MLDTNPTQLQQAPAGNRSAAPLFLLHDGGGTIFNYFMLGDLNRDVYGIHDTKFDTDEGWEGGLREMASLYVSLVKSVRKTGPILLGGWSLGGLVSMEVARLLSLEETAPTVVGLILIDSPYAQAWQGNRHRMVEFTPEFPPRISQTIKSAVTKRMDVCGQIIAGWNVPSWSNVRPAGHIKLPCLYQPLQGLVKMLQTSVMVTEPSNYAQRVGQDQSADVDVPPAVLLRATEWVPKPAGHPEGLVNVDLSRNSEMLGWEEYPYDFLRAVYDVRGHHFDLFDGDDRLDSVTMLIDHACKRLESKKPFLPFY